MWGKRDGLRTADGRPPTFSPEYEDCARVAREQAVPLREVYTAAHAAYAQGRPDRAAPAKPDHLDLEPG